jgi:DNA-binding IclR family transcriptional regulator
MDEVRVRAELAHIARTGHEVMDSFVMRGVVNISAPIIDRSGHAIAAMTIPHVERYHDKIGFNECRDSVIKTARALSKSLGGGAAEADTQAIAAAASRAQPR